MARITAGKIIKTSIVSGLTIATALIWKDVILEVIAVIMPLKDQLLFNFTAAVLATIFIVILIYIFLKTEDEFEFIIRKIKKKQK